MQRLGLLNQGEKQQRMELVGVNSTTKDPEQPASSTGLKFSPECVLNVLYVHPSVCALFVCLPFPKRTIMAWLLLDEKIQLFIIDDHR